MPDWAEHLRSRLAVLRLTGAREAEIIEELSQHLDQRYDELRAGGTSSAEARRLALQELADAETLRRDMSALRQAHVPPPITPGASHDESNTRWPNATEARSHACSPGCVFNSWRSSSQVHSTTGRSAIQIVASRS